MSKFCLHELHFENQPFKDTWRNLLISSSYTSKSDSFSVTIISLLMAVRIREKKKDWLNNLFREIPIC